MPIEIGKKIWYTLDTGRKEVTVQWQTEFPTFLRGKRYGKPKRRKPIHGGVTLDIDRKSHLQKIYAVQTLESQTPTDRPKDRKKKESRSF